MFAPTWVLSLATVATAVFSRQIGSLARWIDCKVVVVAVVITDTLDESSEGLELLVGRFEFLLPGASLSLYVWHKCWYGVFLVLPTLFL